MKKTLLFGLAAGLAMSFAACDNYDEPNPQPQTNLPESVLKTDMVNVTSAVTTETYDLTALNNEGANVVVANVEIADFPQSYELLAEAWISVNGFAKSTPVETEVIETETPGLYQVVITPDALQAAFAKGVSKGKKARDIEVRFLLETKISDQLAVIGGPTNYYGPYKLNVLPIPSSIVIEDAYYLIGSFCNWDVTKAVKLSHSDEDVYDDPVFTVKVEVTNDQAAEGWGWQIIPASTFDAGSGDKFGPAEDGDDAAEGSLVEGANKGMFKEAGPYMLTINMEKRTYEFSPAFDYLYTPGDANGWNQGNSQMLFTNDYVKYMGYALLSPNGFKFTSAPDWNHINYGDAGEEGELSTDGGAGNLSVPVFGLYYCNVNIANLTYSTYHVETIGLIGDATEGGWNESTPLTTTDNLIWKGTVKLTDGTFKFRCNNAWDANLGGALENLIPGGDNISTPNGAGTYDVTLNLSTLPYSATVVKK